MVAVLTHKGRSADSGHYVAWVKQESGEFLFSDTQVIYIKASLDLNIQLIETCLFLVLGKWIEYDDDNPIPQREEDITKLSGGGKRLAQNYPEKHLFN